MRILLVLLAALALSACNAKETTSEPADAPRDKVAAPSAPKPAAGATGDLPAQVTDLVVIDRAKGAGAAVAAGDNVSVHYTGWLYDPTAPEGKGAKFDSSRDRGQPFRFPLGQGRVIKGWDQGVAGMQVGAQRRLIIPADMAYGARGFPPVIPANATLLFDVELLAVE